MNARTASCAAAASALMYILMVSTYSAAVRSSSERSALLERAVMEDRRLAQESVRDDALRGQLAAMLRRFTLVTDARSFERLVQRMALVAGRSHVHVTGLVPDATELRDVGSRFRGHGLTIRVRARFADAVTFVRLLPSAGILLRIRDVAFAGHQDAQDSATLDLTLHVILLRPASDWLREAAT